MATNKPNNATVIDKCTQRINALKQYVQPNAQILINGKPYTATQVIGMYQSCIDSRATLATARAEVTTDVVAVKATEVSRREADRFLKPFVNAQFGVGSKQAIDFGFPAPKKATRTTASKSKAVAQAEATRKARNTMGPKEKLKIKGVVPETQPEVVPANEPAPKPAEGTQPAPVAPATAASNGTPAKS